MVEVGSGRGQPGHGSSIVSTEACMHGGRWRRTSSFLACPESNASLFWESTASNIGA